MTCTDDKDACWYQSFSRLSNDFIYTYTNQENVGLGNDETIFRSCIDSAGLGDHCLNS